MFRCNTSKLAVGTFVRFLMDGKGKHTGISGLKRAKLIGAEFNALKRDPAQFAELAKRAANTPKPKKRVPVPRKATQYGLFTKAAFASKAVTTKGKPIAAASKKVAAIWKKYKAAVEAKQGKPLAKGTTNFDLNLLRSLA